MIDVEGAPQGTIVKLDVWGWLRRPRHCALLITLLSLAAWVAWSEMRTTRHTFADLSRGNFTDHFSHMNAARVFPRVGLRLWKEGPQKFLRGPRTQEFKRMPADIRVADKGDIFMLPGLALDKPWVTGWSHNPRLYPPGHLLLFAPAAA